MFYAGSEKVVSIKTRDCLREALIASLPATTLGLDRTLAFPDLPLTVNLTPIQQIYATSYIRLAICKAIRIV